MNNDRPDRLAATLALDESVGRVRLVSPARARALDGLGIRTVRDLATHFPRRYIDLSRKATVAAGVIGEQCTVEGAVHEIKLKKPKPRLTLVELSLVDGTGVLMVTCFRQPWLMDQVKPGMRIAVAGKLEFNYGFKRMTNPYLEVLDGEGAAEGMIIPVHPACEKISAAWMRRLVGNALEAVCGLHDPLPLELRAKYRLMSRGEQVYVVCPLIGQDSGERDAKAADGGSGGRRREADEEAYEYAAISIETDDDLEGDDVAAAAKEASYLQGTVFADYRVELLHGRMPASEKQAVMQRFRDNETQVLVATTVIEVGVDVPNATVMIVEDADRFGLSQLHQLRGRVGRGEKAAEVHLVSASKSDAALTRLSAMVDTDDGFELASYDLSLRREGDILGNRQHGASGLKLVNVMRDGAVIEAAHADAAAILEEDPNLELPAHRALAREVRIVYANDHVAQGG